MEISIPYILTNLLYILVHKFMYIPNDDAPNYPIRRVQEDNKYINNIMKNTIHIIKSTLYIASIKNMTSYNTNEQ